MRACAKCGHYNSPDSIFCGHCANRLNNNCPNCGYQNLREQKFCGNCGKQLLTDAVAKEASSPHESDNTLASYALISIECLQPKTLNYQELDFLKTTIIKGGGQISTIRANILFVVFKGAPNQAASLEQAIRLSQYLLSPAFDIRDKGGEEFLSLRIGLAIEKAAARNPLTSTPERSVAEAGDLVIGELAYSEIANPDSQWQRMEPVTIGSHAMIFYRWRALSERKSSTPLNEEPLSSSSRVRTDTPKDTVERGPQLAAPDDYQASKQIEAPSQGIKLSPKSLEDRPSPVSDRERVPGISSDEPPLAHGVEPFLHQPDPYETPPENYSQKNMDQPLQTQFDPKTTNISISVKTSDKVKESESLQDSAFQETVIFPSQLEPSDSGNQPERIEPNQQGEIPFPQFEAPVLGMYQAPRHGNLNYQNAVDTLSSELDAFLTLESNPNAPKQGIRGKVLALCGADGLGKSSLIHMARMKTDPKNQRAIWMGGYHYRSFQNNPLPLYYWIEILQNLLSLLLEGQGSSESKDHLHKFLSHLPENTVSKEMLNFLNDLLLIQQPKPLSVESRQRLGRIDIFFRDFFRCLAQRRPLILVMEDLMFADAASLEVLIHLLERNLLNEPFYLILTQRRDFYAQGALADIFKKIPYQELVVEELSPVEAGHFLNEGPLGGQLLNFPQELIERVIHDAKGLPFLIEEILRLLHLQDVLVVDPLTTKFVMNTAKLAGRETAPIPLINLPDNFNDMLQSRLTFLDDKARYVLNLAAMLGEKFPVNILMVLSQMEETPFNETMTLLFNHGLLLPDAMNTGRFRHGLIWEAVYQSMDATLRVQMHQLVSEMLENDLNQGMTVNPLIMAYHSEHAQMPNRAVNHWNLSDIYVGQLGSLTGMNIALYKAMHLSDNRPLEPALRAMESLGVFNLDTNPDQAVRMLDWVIFYRKSEGNPLKLIEPLGFLSTAYRNKGDFIKALNALEQAVTCIDTKRHPLEVVSLQINMLEYLFTLGRLQTFRELLDGQVIPLVSEHGYGPDTLAFQESYLQAHLWKAQVMLAQCDPETEAFIQNCVKQAQEQGFAELVLSFKLVSGQYALYSGQYARCDKEATHLLEAIEGFGKDNKDTDWLLAQWGLLAIQYHCAMEDWTSASQLILTVTTKAEAIRDYYTWVTAQIYAGHITAKLGKISEGRQLLEKALELSAQYRFTSAALLGWRLLAELESACKNITVAIEIADRAEAIANKPEVRNHHEAYQLTLFSSSLTLTQSDNTTTTIKTVGKRLEELWPKIAKTHLLPLIAACAYEIGFLYKQMAQNVPADLSRKYLTRSIEFLQKAKGIWSDLKLTARVQQVDQVIPRL